MTMRAMGDGTSSPMPSLRTKKKPKRRKLKHVNDVDDAFEESAEREGAERKKKNLNNDDIELEGKMELNVCRRSSGN